MRTILLALTFLALSTAITSAQAATQELRITGWKQTEGLSEEQAVTMAREALHQELAVDEDGEVCGIDEMYNWEREKDLVPDFPKERGQILAMNGFARGPHTKMGCSSSEIYDCRVVYNRLTPKQAWKVEYVECEAGGGRYGDE